MGYLHAKREDTASRWEELTGAGKTPDMPQAGPLSYMLPLWRELGRAHSTGFGPATMPHAEIEAFGVREGLTAKERRLLRSMSDAYINGLALGRDVFAIPPWDGSHG
ncbi:MAG: hypothetical protein Unbinned338contig1000_52 [Prokaryotic dsDNA virus sp.]|nr:MAG: hypothetical protein Unbinned338contig1000_52 [Prokaryotic dsDNA virus sp.]|tara:strand:+ start:30379 stop:30699 length:321 start_codon:yes stop_codon:yes gene_type:complete